MKSNLIYSSFWCNEVFEGKNKLYGAYQLRRVAGNNTWKGLLFSSCFVSLGIAIPLLIANRIEKFTEQRNELGKQIVYEINSIDARPEIVKPAIHKKRSATKSTEHPSLTGKKNLNEETNPNAAAQNNHFTGPISDSTGITNGLEEEKSDTITEDNTEYRPVGLEENPEFPGGEMAMLDFLKRNIKFPSDAYAHNRSGIVYVSFLIDKKGRVKDPEILQGVKSDPAFGTEVIRVINLFPIWKPGKQNGQQVSVRYTLPVNFSIRRNF